MNKKIALAVGIALSANVAGTVLAAPTKLFAVIPENHWSYGAVSQLAKAGIVDGFGGAPYRGDAILTRYEMAAIVAKAMARADKVGDDDKALLEKLSAEFAPELNMNSADDSTDWSSTSNIDNSHDTVSRLEKLEKKASTVKMTGDTRVRYQSNWNQQAKNRDDKTTSRIQQRVRLNVAAQIDDNLTLAGRLTATNDSNKRGTVIPPKESKTNSSTFDKAELKWKNKQLTVSLGRMLPSLGQGLLWDYNSVDGVLAGYDFGKAHLFAGYGDLAAYTGGATKNAFLANLRIRVVDNAEISVGHLNTMTNAIKNEGYNFAQTAYGFKVKSGEVTMLGEYVKNNDGKLPVGAQDHGYWGRILWKGINNSKPGTYGINFDYLKLGNYAVDSTNNPSTLVVSGGNGINKDGAQGYGFGVQYVFAKNANLEARYYNLKPYDTGKAGFSSYKDSYHFITNYRF